MDDNDDILTFCISDERVKCDGSASAGVSIQLYQSPANDVEQVRCQSLLFRSKKKNLTRLSS